MNKSRLMTFALTITVMAVALIVAGCTSTSTPTPTPAPSATPAPAPTITATPVNKTLENMYQLVERYSTGIDDHNAGVGFVKTAQNLFNESDYSNASRYMDMAADKMETAKSEFESMLWYASTSQETLLSQTWTDAADLYASSYRNASLAYQENAYQMTRPKDNQNFVKFNYYVDIANAYNVQATESRKQAEALGNGMTFTVPVATPVN